MQITLNALEQEYLTDRMMEAADCAVGNGEDGELELDIVTSILHQLENSQDETELVIQVTIAAVNRACKSICRASSMNQYLSQLMDIEDRLKTELLARSRQRRKG